MRVYVNGERQMQRWDFAEVRKLRCNFAEVGENWNCNRQFELEGDKDSIRTREREREREITDFSVADILVPSGCVPCPQPPASLSFCQ